MRIGNFSKVFNSDGWDFHKGLAQKCRPFVLSCRVCDHLFISRPDGRVARINAVLGVWIVFRRGIQLMLFIGKATLCLRSEGLVPHRSQGGWHEKRHILHDSNYRRRIKISSRNPSPSLREINLVLPMSLTQCAFSAWGVLFGQGLVATLGLQFTTQLFHSWLIYIQATSIASSEKCSIPPFQLHTYVS